MKRMHDTEVHPKGMVIAYPVKDGLYLNITNRCTNRCLFCIRNNEKGIGYNLWLEREPTVEEIIQAIEDPSSYAEVVFCGYGEPLLRGDAVIEVARWLKAHDAKKIRINTNGLADLFLDYDIVPLMKGLIDTVSISLNAHNAEEYQKVSRSRYGERAYEVLLDFTKRCRQVIPEVVLTVVDYPGVDVEKARAVAAGLGVQFRVRHYINE